MCEFYSQTVADNSFVVQVRKRQSLGRSQSFTTLHQQTDVTVAPAYIGHKAIFEIKGETIMSTKHAFASITHVLAGMSGRIRAARSRRQTERVFARFSNHELADMGFERDWDGSAYRPSDYR